MTRRRLLSTGLATAAVAGLDAWGPGSALQRVLAAPAKKCGRLEDIEHVVIFINENRSFDHYFGTFPGVRGFDDPNAPLLSDGSGLSNVYQPFPGDAGKPYGGHLLPFRFDTQNGNGECVNDIGHQWEMQHQAWNGGAMDRFLDVHLKESTRDGANTMGYYTRADVPFYHALASAFTVCDGYYCSVIGGTDANRLYSLTGTLDPDGKNGGPHLDTLVTNRPSKFGAYTWTTYPEQLQARGISWKIYSTADGNLGDNVLPYFKKYQQDPQLAANAFVPTFPGTFQADCAAGTLPQVSWVMTQLVQSEHPPAPVAWGEDAVAQLMKAVTSNPDVWAKTAVFITFDENGGFFDHVPPPVAPAGTAGEYLTVANLPPEAGGIRGPIGLGFRVPMIIASPFTRGGYVCSDTFDHTSTLRFLESRFGAEVPNLSDWRRSVTGDLTSAFSFGAEDKSVPRLPSTSLADPRVLTSNCPENAPDVGDPSFPTVQGYPLPPAPQPYPHQQAGTPKRPAGCRTRPSRQRQRRSR